MIVYFRGKFGQKENLPSTVIVNQPYELSDLVENPALNVLSITELNMERFVVTYEHKDCPDFPNPYTNVVVAAFTTAFARLKLYSYLKLLGSRVLYYDTGLYTNLVLQVTLLLVGGTFLQ